MTDLLDRAADAANHAYFANLHKPDPFAFVALVVARAILTEPASGELELIGARSIRDSMRDINFAARAKDCWKQMAAALLAELEAAADRSGG